MEKMIKLDYNNNVIEAGRVLCSPTDASVPDIPFLTCKELPNGDSISVCLAGFNYVHYGQFRALFEVSDGDDVKHYIVDSEALDGVMQPLTGDYNAYITHITGVLERMA